MNYKTVKNPKWANAEHTFINCEVDFDDLREEFVPFTASKDDVEAHSIEIFNRTVKGDFGEITEYIVPYEQTLEGIAAARLAVESNLKTQILALNPAAKFPNDADSNSDNVVSIEELHAYLKYLQEKALLAKFEG
jgi:hypothetical protein